MHISNVNTTQITSYSVITGTVRRRDRVQFIIVPSSFESNKTEHKAAGKTTRIPKVRPHGNGVRPECQPANQARSIARVDHVCAVPVTAPVAWRLALVSHWQRSTDRTIHAFAALSVVYPLSDIASIARNAGQEAPIMVVDFEIASDSEATLASFHQPFKSSTEKV